MSDMAYVVPVAVIALCALAVVAFAGWLGHRESIAPEPAPCVCECVEIDPLQLDTLQLEPLKGNDDE